MKKKILSLLLVGVLSWCGCGGNCVKVNEHPIPDPETVFSSSECIDYTEYELDKINLEGIQVKYSGKDIRSDYKKYIKKCKEDDFWVHPVFIGETSWCYRNEDETVQIAVNLYEEEQIIDICVKVLSDPE